MTQTELNRLFPISYHSQDRKIHSIKYPRVTKSCCIFHGEHKNGDGSLLWYIYLDKKGNIEMTHSCSDMRGLPREIRNTTIPLDVLMPFIEKNKDIIISKLREIGYW